MAVKITYADGKTEIISEAVNVDYNYQEGTYDFCDEKGQPMKQLVMATGVTWAYLAESETASVDEVERDKWKNKGMEPKGIQGK